MSRATESKKRVAIVGAGPGGLAAARYLLAHGFEPVLFEQSDDIGGQWNAKGAHSGVWPNMRANSTRVMTYLSDLPHAPDVLMYARNQQMLAYLHRYAEKFGLMKHVRLRTPVEKIERGGKGTARYLVSFKPDGGASTQEGFDYVIIASGRFNKPTIPNIPGLQTFNGPGGVSHSFHYKNPEKYRGMRVVVGGCSISALEIASDLAMMGNPKVISTLRRQRYVMAKITGGVPNEHVSFNRWGAIATDVFGPEQVAEWARQFIVRTSGSPEQYGAFKPPSSLIEAGATLSQSYLPLIAEGKITQKPWIKEINGQRVTFSDGTTEEVDALIMSTGYNVNLPYLSDEIRKIMDIDDKHIDLHHFTFHPDLEGLAFVGMFMVEGPFWTLLELQARWVVYTWANVVRGPSVEEMREGVARYRQTRGQPQDQDFQTMVIGFSRLLGVEPNLEQYPQLKRPLLFGPLSPAGFRLNGPDAFPGAADMYAADAAAFGAFTTTELTPEETAKFEMLKSALQANGLIGKGAQAKSA